MTRGMFLLLALMPACVPAQTAPTPTHESQSVRMSAMRTIHGPSRGATTNARPQVRKKAPW